MLKVQAVIRGMFPCKCFGRTFDCVVLDFYVRILHRRKFLFRYSSLEESCSSKLDYFTKECIITIMIIITVTIFIIVNL